MVTSETQEPAPSEWVDHYERGLDPWHADAFRGTPGEGVIGSGGPRQRGWYAMDYCRNVIGFVADGTPVSESAQTQGPMIMVVMG